MYKNLFLFICKFIDTSYSPVYICSQNSNYNINRDKNTNLYTYKAYYATVDQQSNLQRHLII